MKDYRVTVKVRNNRILKAIEAAGGEPGAKWCEEKGLSYQNVNALINMKKSPLAADGSLSAAALMLCDVLNVIPDDLWSNDQIYPLERNFSELEMNKEEITALIESSNGVCVLDTSKFEQEQARKLLDGVIKKLPPQIRKIIEFRFYQDMSLDDCAKALGVTRERARQIEAKALRMLRHPTKIGGIIDLTDIEGDEKEYYKLAANGVYNIFLGGEDGKTLIRTGTNQIYSQWR